MKREIINVYRNTTPAGRYVAHCQFDNGKHDTIIKVFFDDDYYYDKLNDEDESIIKVLLDKAEEQMRSDNEYDYMFE